MLGRRLRLALVALSALVAALGAVPASAQTLDAVRSRGYVICASSDPLPGFAQEEPDGRWSGFDIDFCKALATAVFGDPTRLEYRPLSGEGRFAPLQIGQVDVMARASPWTMRRDTFYGASYVGASFFDGQGFMVPAALGIVSSYELEGVSVCVLRGGDQQSNLRDFFFQTQSSYVEVLYEDPEDLGVAYQAGLCDAVSARTSLLHAIRRGLPEPGQQRILPERISKEAFGPMVRAGDDQWFKIVQWTLFTLINAEEMGVSSTNISSLSAARSHRIRRLLGLERKFGVEIGLSPDFMHNIIANVGNYGEIFERNFGAGSGTAVLRGQNALWTNGGLLYAPPVE